MTQGKSCCDAADRPNELAVCGCSSDCFILIRSANVDGAYRWMHVREPNVHDAELVQSRAAGAARLRAKLPGMFA